MQLRFWQGYVAYLQNKRSVLRPHTPRPQHWLNTAIGRGGFELSATVNVRENRLAISIYIQHEQSKAYFQQLHQRKIEIEQQLGFTLDWQELPDAHACRIEVARTESPLSDEERWPEYFAWLAECGEKFDRIFRPLIKGLA